MNAVTPQETSPDAIWQKLKPHKFIALFAGALLIFFLIALVVILIVKPGATKPPCSPEDDKPCGRPPTLPSAAAVTPLVSGKIWRSKELGYQFEYDSKRWKVSSQSARSVVLNWSISSRPDLDLTLIVQATPLSESAPAQLLQKQINALKGDVLGLKADTSPKHAVLGPNIGYVDGQAAGGPYAGTLDTPQGPGPRIALLTEAATDGKISVAITAATASPESIKLALMDQAESLLNTFQWPTGAEAQSSGSSQSVALPASRPKLAARNSAKAADRYVGRTSPSKRLGFSLVLQFDQDALDRYISETQDPNSPNYRHYLSAREIGQRFGISDAEIAHVKRALKAAGLQVNVAYAQRTAIRASGSVAKISAFFDTSLGDFREPSGRVYHKPLRTPKIPASIRRSVVGVTGLSNRSLALPAAIPQGGLTPKVTAKAYNLEPLHRAGIQGQGQTVAIVSFDSFNDSDPKAFDKQFGITGPKVLHRRVAGGTPVGEGSVEVNLDIDVIRSVAPKAQIINYEGPNGGVGYGDMLNAIVQDGKADIASISWGNCDDASNLSVSERRNTTQSFKAAVARGITIFVASGDAGAFSCQRRFLEDHRLTAEFPGDSPYVISVGGTRLATAADGTYHREYGWEDSLANGGGGGGLNPKDPRPAWQTGPGVKNKFSNGKRQFPDVAAAADPDSGFFVVSGGQLFPVGGTSAATPFWAGSLVLIRQLAQKQGAGKLGFIAPMLYQLAKTKPSPFHDVVAGGNRYYNAGSGWDYATGLGSPDVAKLAPAVIKYLKSH